jgi:hypothetical protein
MTEYLDSSAVELPPDQITPLSEPTLPPSSNPTCEGAAPSATTSYEGGTKTELPLWQPTDPQFTKAVAAYYGVSRKSVQQWFQKVKDACPWFTEDDLKLPDERYTPLCVELMGRYRTAGLPFEAWKTQVWAQNPELVAAYQASQNQPPASGNRDHPTTSRSLVSTGLNFLMALEEEQAELQKIEASELRLLHRMSDSFERLTHASAQWDQANHLRRQRLLRLTRLQAASLAVELEEEFETTLRETQYQIQRGNLPSLGKPPAEAPQSA